MTASFHEAGVHKAGYSRFVSNCITASAYCQRDQRKSALSHLDRAPDRPLPMNEAQQHNTDAGWQQFRQQTCATSAIPLGNWTKSTA
jgi:hypothetical protein